MRSVSKLFGLASAVLIALLASLPACSQVVLLPVVTDGAGLAPGSGSSICSSALDSVGDGCPATQSSIGANPQYLWGDSYGNIYIGDYANYRIRVIFHGGGPVQALIAAANPTLVEAPRSGYIYSIGGGATAALESATAYCAGSSGAQATDQAGNGCPASQAFLHPYAGDTDAAGDVFFIDRAAGTQVRVIYGGGAPAAKLIQMETGVTSPVVGSVYLVGGSATGTNGYSGDGGLATAATFDASHSVSVDENENLYIADTANNVIRMISGATGLVSPVAGGLGAGCVVGKASSCTASYAGDGGPATQASLNNPYDAIADSYGNIFISDGGNLRIRVIYAGGTLPGISSPTVGNIYTLSGGGTATASGSNAISLKYSNPRDVALDPVGNIYVTDTTTWRVWRIDRSTGVADTLIGSGTNQAAGNYCGSTSATAGLKSLDTVADGCPGTQVTFKPLSRYIFDQNGVGYVTDYNNALVRAATIQPHFPDTAYGSSSSISIVETYTSSFKAPALQAGMQGSIAGDFGSSVVDCVPGTSYSANTVCTYMLTFTPSAPGRRVGYYQFLTSGTTTVLSSAAISGAGIAPLLGITPAAVSTLAVSSASVPLSASVDETGNLYISDAGSGSLLKGATSGGTFSAVATGLSQPGQSAVDGFGNLYIADTGNNRILEVNAAGVTSTFASGLRAPRGVAIDENGAVFVSDSGANRVLVFANGAQRVLPLEGLNTPSALAFDANGNLYIADNGSQRIVEYSALQIQSTVATGLTAMPVGLAADAAGDLYLTDSLSNSLWEVAAGTGASVVLQSGLSSVGGLALDALGDLFFTQPGIAGVHELALSSGSLTLGTTTAQQTLTLQNIGNSALTFSSPAYMASGDTTSFSTTSDTCSGAAISMGGTCVLGESYISTAGASSTETLTFHSDAINSVGALATVEGGIPLVATQLSLDMTSPSTGVIAFGQQVTFAATITPATLTATPSGTLTIQVDGATYTTINVSGLRMSFNDTFGVGSHMVTATYSGDKVYAGSRTSFTVSVAKTSANVELSAASTMLAYGATETLTATVSSTTTGTPTGSVAFYSGTLPIGTAPLSGGKALLSVASTNVGATSVTAIYSGDASFNTANSNTITVTTLDADFVFTPTVGSQTIFPQGLATYTLTLTPVSPAVTLTSATSFTVTGLPAGASYTLNPTSITAGSGTSTVSLVVLVPNISTSAAQKEIDRLGFGGHGRPLTLAFLVFPLGWFSRRRGRKALGKMALTLLTTAVMIAASGCGNSSGYFAQAPKTYNVTVVATSGTTAHSTNVVLTVQ